MSLLLAGPVLFFEPDELDALVLEFSDRIRRNGDLAPALSQLIGNRWAEAEAAAVGFLASALSWDARPEIDEAVLQQAGSLLRAEDVQHLLDALLESALKCLPLQSAALVSEIADDLGAALKAIIALDGPARRQLLRETQAKLSAGALQSSH